MYRTAVTSIWAGTRYITLSRIILQAKKVKVIYTRSLVKVFSPEGERVAVHMRCTVPGRYCTVEAHMPSYYNDYVNLSPPEVYRPCGSSVRDTGHTSSERSSETTPIQFRSSTINHVTGCSISSGPQTRNSSKRHGRAAIEFDACRYPFIKNLIESKCAGLDNDEESTLFPEAHANIRGKEYFADK